MKLQKVLALSFLTVASLNAENFEQDVAKGKNASNLLLKTLGSELKKQIETGNILQAVDFCSKQAFDLTNQINQNLEKGISVKRVSMKNRSSVNLPNQDEAKIIAMFEKNNSQEPILTKVENNQKGSNDEVYKFYQPIKIANEMCLKCHGTVEDMPEAVRKKIHELYPQDLATGYKMGDLRGAVIVTINKNKEN